MEVQVDTHEAANIASRAPAGKRCRAVRHR